MTCPHSLYNLLLHVFMSFPPFCICYCIYYIILQLFIHLPEYEFPKGTVYVLLVFCHHLLTQGLACHLNDK